jgi:hypothetical protein
VGEAYALRRLNKAGKANSVPCRLIFQGNILRQRIGTTGADGEEYVGRDDDRRAIS